MTTEAIEALVLHKRPSGDTSVYVSFFTREKGLVHCLFKGGRTPKKQGLLQPFTPLWLAINTHKDRYYVHQLEPVKQAFELKGMSLFSGLYVNELLYHLLPSMDPCPEFFNLYLDTLKGLDTVQNNLALEIVLRHFEWHLLLISGYAISFTEEITTSTPIVAHQYYQFIAAKGFIMADKGVCGEDILALAEGSLNNTHVLKTAKRIMRQAIDHLLEGKKLKSRSLVSRQY